MAACCCQVDNYLQVALEMCQQGLLSADSMKQVAEATIVDLIALRPLFAQQWPRRPMVWHSRCEEYLRSICAINSELAKGLHTPVPTGALKRAQIQILPGLRHAPSLSASLPARTPTPAAEQQQTTSPAQPTQAPSPAQPTQAPSTPERASSTTAAMDAAKKLEQASHPNVDAVLVASSQQPKQTPRLALVSNLHAQLRVLSGVADPPSSRIRTRVSELL